MTRAEATRDRGDSMAEMTGAKVVGAEMTRGRSD